MPAIALILALLLQVSISGNTSVNGNSSTGGPVISGLTASPDANTVLLSWTTDRASTTYAYCGSQHSLYDASQNSVTSHSIPVPQLSPSTLYTCYACSSGSCASINSTTTATPTSTPITSISLGSTTSVPGLMGDSLWNTVADDGNTYVLSSDSNGFLGTAGCSYTTIVGKFTSLSTFAGTNINDFTNWPGCTINPGISPAAEYPHMISVISVGGNLFGVMTNAATCGGSTLGCFLWYGSMFYSPDHGATWNTQSYPSVFNANPVTNSPANLRLWPSGWPYFDASQFIQQGADDGTLGYAVADNRVLNANAYIYGVSNAYNFGSNKGVGISGAGDDLYLWRVPRAQLADLNPSEYQFYVSGDGTQASAWTNNQGNAGSILHDDCNGTNLPNYPGCIGNPSIAYIPALNRYLMCYYWWNNGNSSPLDTTWRFYESPTPWGPWTLVTTLNYTDGSYGPIILEPDALSATFASTQIRLIWTGNFQSYSTYHMYYATMTVNH